MIPYLVTARYRRSNGRWLRLYVPVPLALVVLSPLLLLAAAAGVAACLVFGVRPLGAVRGIGRVLWALPGTRVEIDDGHMALLVSVR